MLQGKLSETYTDTIYQNGKFQTIIIKQTGKFQTIKQTVRNVYKFNLSEIYTDTI